MKFSKEERIVQWLKIVLFLSGGLWLANELHSIKIILQNL
jgi:hypothetical protein